MDFYFLITFCIVESLIEVKATEGFISLGSFKQKSPSIGRSLGAEFKIINYFISTNEASWEAAESDCEQTFEPNGHLLNIETKQEWKFLRELMSKQNSGFMYWTGGMYDKSSGKFLWVHGNELPDWAPWGPDPSKKGRLNSNIRVTVVHEGRHSGTWEVSPKTNTLRFICEYALKTNPGETTFYPKSTTINEESTTVGQNSTTGESGENLTTIFDEKFTHGRISTPSDLYTNTENSDLSNSSNIAESTTNITAKLCLEKPNNDELMYVTKVNSIEYFYGISNNLPYQEAQKYCNKYNMVLAEPDAVKDFESLILESIRGNDHIWLGGRSNDDDETFRWNCKGTVINKSLWAEGSPYLTGVDECVIMRYATTTEEGKPSFKNNAIANNKCYEKYRFFCQRDCVQNCPTEEPCCSMYRPGRPGHSTPIKESTTIGGGTQRTTRSGEREATTPGGGNGGESTTTDGSGGGESTTELTIMMSTITMPTTKKTTPPGCKPNPLCGCCCCIQYWPWGPWNCYPCSK